MIDERLRPYIEECQKNKISDEEIIKNLTEHGWPINIVKESMSLLSPPNTHPVSTSNTPPNEILSINAKLPKIIKTISIFFYIIGFSMLFKSFSTIIILLVLNRGITQGMGLPFAFLKFMPILGIMPPISAIAGMIYIYAGLKINKGSKFSFWFGTVSLLTIFIVLFSLGIITGITMLKINTALNNY